LIPLTRWTVGLLLVSTLSCAREQPARVIAASLPPLASIAEFLVRDRFEVVSVLPPGRSEHDYEPSPGEIEGARGARLFAYTHEDMDGWMVRVARGVMGENAPLISMQDTPLARGRDPHLWLDLDLVRDFVPRLADRLASLDPPGAAGYHARAAAFLDSLNALDREATTLLEPVSHAPFAILHPAFENLVHRYHLNLVAVLEQHPEAEALPQTLGEAAMHLRAAGARVIFAEPQLSARPATALAADLGAKVAMLDPLGGPLSPGRATYLDLIRWNTHQLAENLR
jgi:ABC-type Zn uptake system ZnuABC Zn-binding protein ZnuA